MPAPRPAELLDAEAVATRLGVSVRQVQALASRRQIAHVRVGRLLRFTPEGVAAFIEANTVGAEHAGQAPRRELGRGLSGGGREIPAHAWSRESNQARATRETPPYTRTLTLHGCYTRRASRAGSAR